MLTIIFLIARDSSTIKTVLSSQNWESWPSDLTHGEKEKWDFYQKSNTKSTKNSVRFNSPLNVSKYFGPYQLILVIVVLESFDSIWPIDCLKISLTKNANRYSCVNESRSQDIIYCLGHEWIKLWYFWKWRLPVCSRGQLLTASRLNNKWQRSRDYDDGERLWLWGLLLTKSL